MSLHVVCNKAGNETGELELKDMKESEDCLPDFLTGMTRASRFPEFTFSVGRSDTRME